MGYEFVVIDCETTGVNPKTAEVIEVYAREYNLNGDTGKVLHRRFYPQSGVISAGATAVHGIKIEDLRAFPIYLSADDYEIVRFIGGRVATGWNIDGYDAEVLRMKGRIRTLDIMKLMGPRKDNGRWYRLGDACAVAGIPFNPSRAHGAGYDAQKCMEMHCRIHRDRLYGSTSQSKMKDMISKATTDAVSKVVGPNALNPHVMKFASECDAKTVERHLKSGGILEVATDGHVKIPKIKSDEEQDIIIPTITMPRLSY